MRNSRYAGRSERGAFRRRGASAVEFAIVAPVFFLIVLGVLEFGRMMMVQQVITSASREGARVGIRSGATTAQVTTAVNNYLTANSVKGTTVTVSPDPPSSATSGASVTITVSVPFTSVSWLPAPFFLGSKTLRAQCIMSSEQ